MVSYVATVKSEDTATTLTDRMIHTNWSNELIVMS